MTAHSIERLWREIGLPEYFLGNGGSNAKLYALYDAIVEDCAKIAEPWAVFFSDSATETDKAIIAVRSEIAKKIRKLAHPDDQSK